MLTYILQKRINNVRIKLDAQSFENQLKVEQQQGTMALISAQKYKLLSENDKIRNGLFNY